jgi:hypothetical protein
LLGFSAVESKRQDSDHRHQTSVKKVICHSALLIPRLSGDLEVYYTLFPRKRNRRKTLSRNNSSGRVKGLAKSYSTASVSGTSNDIDNLGYFGIAAGGLTGSAEPLFGNPVTGSAQS